MYKRQGIPVTLSQPPVLVDDSSIDPAVERYAGYDQSGSGPQTLVMFYATPDFDINHLIQSVYDHWGSTVGYLGAGAGSTQLTTGHWVFNGPETATNSAVLAMINSDSSMNLTHGWKPVAGPLVASRCEGNRICELNWRPAYDVYREALPRSLNITLPRDLIQRVSRIYPLAIAPTEDGEAVIRTLFDVDDDGALLMVCSVPENSTLYIAHGRPDNLMNHAKALSSPFTEHNHPNSQQLLISCIARYNLLGPQLFGQEIANIQQAFHQPLFGVASLGEIASDGKRYFDVHHKAVALAQLHA